MFPTQNQKPPSSVRCFCAICWIERFFSECNLLMMSSAALKKSIFPYSYLCVCRCLLKTITRKSFDSKFCTALQVSLIKNVEGIRRLRFLRNSWTAYILFEWDHGRNANMKKKLVPQSWPFSFPLTRNFWQNKKFLFGNVNESDTFSLGNG